VKERPILFSGPMVRAILEGRKTQTRRVVRPQPENGISPCHYSGTGWAQTYADGGCGCTYPLTCPSGIPGDRLWVRETWAPLDGAGQSLNALMAPPECRAMYRADQSYFIEPVRWRPSIHMPRWASRILLEVTDVRVQRLQEISEEDAKAEGVGASDWVEMRDGSPCYSWPFRSLWDSLHGTDNPAAWDANPFVWCLSFRRIHP
jgi:hypothetical protein